MTSPTPPVPPGFAVSGVWNGGAEADATAFWARNPRQASFVSSRNLFWLIESGSACGCCHLLAGDLATFTNDRLSISY